MTEALLPGDASRHPRFAAQGLLRAVHADNLMKEWRIGSLASGAALG
jgi:hypothetical protein